MNKEEVISFIKVIIEETNNEEKAKEQIEKFKKYLILSKISNDEIINTIDQIIENIPSYYKMNDLLDSKSKTKKTAKPKKVVKPKKEEKVRVIEKHYHHYHDSSSSSGCGSSRPRYSTGCGGSSSSSYSSGC